MYQGIVATGEPRVRRWATDGGLDRLTVIYVEWDFGDNVAASMIHADGHLIVQFNPRLFPRSAGFLLRFWAKRQYQVGWDQAVLGTKDVARMLCG